MLINVLNMLKHTAAIVENDWTLWEISSKPLQHTPGTPKYKYMKYVRISLMNRWFRVWGTFQGYVGLSFETPQNNPAILIHIRLDDPVFCGPFFWAPWFWPTAILTTLRIIGPSKLASSWGPYLCYTGSFTLPLEGPRSKGYKPVFLGMTDKHYYPKK